MMELLITIGLVSALLAALWAMSAAGTAVFYTQEARSAIKAHTGKALFIISQELRQAVSVTGFSAANVTCSGDFDNDGVNETVCYVWPGIAGAPFNRTSGTLTFPLVSSARTVSFSFYDANNTLLPFPAAAPQVKVVSVNITASDGDETFTMRSGVVFRAI